jgi:hypothetical protein
MSAARPEAEHMRLVAERDGARTDLEEARATCAGLVAEPCAAFGSEDAARAFLDAGARAPLPTTWSDEIVARRPDLAALAAAERAADERRSRSPASGDPRRHPAPRPPTTRSSRPARSARVSASACEMPLPVADHGQADEGRPTRLC